MRYVEYEDKDKKKNRAIDINETLMLMNELESFNGATKEKIVENYYEIKKQFRDVLLDQPEEKEKTKRSVKV